eukprot:CAMPEP_0170563926 /NCGR_PEP_ID=MMETSP0211-20121228/69848_1 /TAXON_ID=311385 /ORGANISM="Pseudokeronopsis sp., Strain OXSARD2" /LENGTH=191 /DNA_ID=CAMNT_0010882779 /DNA_START=86 /DNA_END=661 /DNA_ORIENTATION=+
MDLLPKGHRLDVEVRKRLVLRVHQQVLRLHGNEFREQPRPEQLAVVRLPELIVLVFIDIFQVDHHTVRLYHSHIEELLVELLIGVGVWASKVVALPDSLLHLEAVQDCESHIIGKHWLYSSIHAFYDEVHPVEELHLHAPLASEGRLRVVLVEHERGSQDSHVRVDILHFLFSDPLGPETGTLGVRVCGSC